MKPIKKVIGPVFIILLYFICVSSALANPISEIRRSIAKTDLNRELLKAYGNNYGVVESLLEEGMADYDALCTIPDSPENNRILRDLIQRYYPNFSEIRSKFKTFKKPPNN
jgi:hypothetical protein